MDRNLALSLLRTSLNNPDAQFRSNQWEAIDQLVNQNKKLLVVERTGWGKSSVYFISTRMLRNKGKGLTIIISPLLALMRNQIEAADRLGINAATINSTNTKDWDDIKQNILDNKTDALLISPERLANDEFVETLLRPISNKIGLFVVDEAHCISDWGHDFRTDYRRIISILKFMPDGMPILATTATANNRVIQDIVSQLGQIEIIRGSLVRESLILQNIKLQDQSERLAWLKENIPNMPGNGLIYTLTIRDALQVAEWLNEAGIEAAAYFSGVEHDEFENTNKYRQYLEDLLYNNDMKVLVTTSALGMGYDKPDLGFVIHYQAPGSIITYYQQVGRAGRAIPKAYGILMSGKEDQDVHDYFMNTAFPPKERVDVILKTLEASNGLSIPEIMGKINFRKGQIEQVFQYLSVESPSPVIKTKSKWSRSAVVYTMDTEKIARLTGQKVKEWQEVQRYIEHDKCLMNYLQRALDDPILAPCGKCSKCVHKSIFNEKILHEDILQAALFLKHSEFDFEPKKLISSGALPIYGWSGKIAADMRPEKGKILSRWGDAGWGKIVADDKHDGYFRDELVDAVVEMIEERWKISPQWITCVPSNRRPELVPKFAERLANKLEIPFLPVVIKIKESNAQKEQQNSYFQCSNLDGVFKIAEIVKESPVLLIDDAVDSGWTFTIIAALLRQAGSGPVYPMALTSTSVN